MGRFGWYGGWAPYVPVAQKRANAKRQLPRLLHKGQKACPVECEGKGIASSFWGRAWCDHMESFSDFSNRLPRGRTYVRNGSVCHLEVSEGSVDAFVAGSSLYSVKIAISGLLSKEWKSIRAHCKGGIGSLVELLSGRISDNVMRIVTDRDSGLFPKPGQMKFSCSCPDWASMCKHVAAVLYGVGTRLDEQPDLLFRLRGVNPADLVSMGDVTDITAAKPGAKGRRIDDSRIGEVFGIELEDGPAGAAEPAGAAKTAGRRGKAPKSRAATPAKNNASPGRRDRRQAERRAPIAEEAAMAAFRKAAEGGRLMDDELAIVEAADMLGLAETVCEREEEFRGLLAKAVERGIFEPEGEGRVRTANRSITDYTHEELAGFMLEAAMSGRPMGLQNLASRCAAMLGFESAAGKGSAHVLAAFSSAVRKGLLNRDGRGRIVMA